MEFGCDEYYDVSLCSWRTDRDNRYHYDITEMKEIEEKYEKNEGIIRMILDVMDAKERTIRISLRIARWTGSPGFGLWCDSGQ